MNWRLAGGIFYFGSTQVMKFNGSIYFLTMALSLALDLIKGLTLVCFTLSISDCTASSDSKVNIIENEKIVATLNANPNDHAIYELNEFGVLSAEEFKQQRLMPKRKVTQEIISKRISYPVHDQPQDSFDWEAIGAVTSVKVDNFVL